MCTEIGVENRGGWIPPFGNVLPAELIEAATPALRENTEKGTDIVAYKRGILFCPNKEGVK